MHVSKLQNWVDSERRDWRNSGFLETVLEEQAIQALFTGESEAVLKTELTLLSTRFRGALVLSLARVVAVTYSQRWQRFNASFQLSFMFCAVLARMTTWPRRRKIRIHDTPSVHRSTARPHCRMDAALVAPEG